MVFFHLCKIFWSLGNCSIRFLLTWLISTLHIYYCFIVSVSFMLCCYKHQNSNGFICFMHSVFSIYMQKEQTWKHTQFTINQHCLKLTLSSWLPPPHLIYNFKVSKKIKHLFIFFLILIILKDYWKSNFSVFCINLLIEWQISYLICSFLDAFVSCWKQNYENK